MINSKLLLGLGLVLGVITIGAAQSFNIDLDVAIGGSQVGQGTPSSSYGAASGQFGFWNGIDGSGPNAPTALRDLNGSLSSVTLVATGGTGSSGGFNFAGNTGDFRLLMNDFADIGTTAQYHFAGMQAGHYLIYTYAVDPASAIQHDVVVTVVGAVDPVQHVTGPMVANTFTLGATHAIHDLTITGNTLEIDVSGPDHFTRCNGLQIVAVPEPTAVSAFVFASGLFFRRRCRRK